MSTRLGRNHKLYYNAGSYGSPTWTEVTLVKDGTLNQDTEKADASSRASGAYNADVVTMINLGFEAEIIRDTANAVFLVLETAFYALSPVEFLILDGPVGTTGSRGVRATCQIQKWTRGEPLKGIATQQMTIGPTYADNPPAAYVV
jgi:hypothetical protein